MANKKDPYGPEIIYRFGPFRIVRVIKRLTDDPEPNIDNSEIEIRLEKDSGPDAMGKPAWIDCGQEVFDIGFARLDWNEAENVVKRVQAARTKARKLLGASDSDE